MHCYPDEIQDFIKENVCGRTTKELTEMLNQTFENYNFTESKVKSYKSNHKLKSGTPSGLRKGTANKIFPREIMDFICENYKGVGPKEMASILNNKFGTKYAASQIKGFYNYRKLNSGITGRFEKGHISFNKGKKQSDFLSAEALKRVKLGQFKKGNKPHNQAKVGDIVHNKDGYLVRKVAEPDKWEFEARLVWKANKGELPEGAMITYLDGNKDNVKIDNLAVVSNKENLEMNRSKLRSTNSDITAVGVTVAKLVCATRERVKK